MKTLLVCLFVPFCFAQEKPPIQLNASMPRQQQVALAESAAPRSVSSRASIYVLTKNGYEKAREGSNGFTCLVERDFVGTVGTVEPQCYDAVGSATTLQPALFRESERAKGTSEAEIKRLIEAGFKNGKFKTPAKPGLIYMLSDSTYIVDADSGKVVHVPGHLMFHAPGITYKDLGLNGPADGPPFLTDEGKPDNLMVVIPRKKDEKHEH